MKARSAVLLDARIDGKSHTDEKTMVFPSTLAADPVQIHHSSE